MLVDSIICIYPPFLTTHLTTEKAKYQDMPKKLYRTKFYIECPAVCKLKKHNSPISKICCL